MTTHPPADNAKLRDALFGVLGNERVGMLGLQDSADHMQPMTHYLDRENRCLWFISGKGTHLVGHLGAAPRKAHFTVTASDGKVYACMSGVIETVHDPEKLDELWSPMASMWFDGGKDDPDVALLKMPLDEAAVWLNEAGALRFGIEMIRGATSEHDPDLGEHGVIDLRKAA